MSNPKASVLATMTNKTYTLGWDVLVAYNAAAVNDLFAAQYVSNVRANQDFPPITETIALTSTATVQVAGLTLGPPLISFSPSTTDQESIVTLNFVAGTLLQVTESGNVTYVTGIQTIVPGDDYQLRAVVPLEQVTGSVSSQNNVTVNLKNATSVTTNLLPGTSAASYLGQYFASLFAKASAGGLSYQLGQLLITSGEGLVPTSFSIRTQVYPGTLGPDGAVLLLVATKYNEAGGNYPGAEFPYLIPDGNTCALVLASKTLFSNILAPYYNTTMVGSPTFSVMQFSGSPAASFMAANGGTLSAAPVSGNWSSGAVLYSVWSGQCGFVNTQQNVAIPYSGWTFEPENDQLAISWNNAKFTQKFAGVSTMRNSFCTTSQVQLTLNASMKAALTVSAQQEISLTQIGSPSIDFSFEQSSWVGKFLGNGAFRDKAASTLSGNMKPIVAKAMEVPLPEVDAFAVSHLLFPAMNALSYSSAHLPGDLAVFGQISPKMTQFSLSPIQAVLGPGQEQQFTVSDGETVTWSVFPRLGTISPTGVYTAPATVSSSIPIVITATSPSQDVATAVVTVVPSAIAISPAFSIVLPSTQPIQLQAAVLGGASASWSIAPDDGSVGTISASGLYTPPATLPSTLETAQVMATAASTNASCLLCLADVSIGIGVTPMNVQLAPGATQQFSASPAAGVTWSVQPELGSIDDAGTYTAPSSVSEPAIALVTATLDGAIYGFAPVLLTTT